MVNQLQNEIFLQAGYYAAVMIIAVVGIGVMQRGFFWKYLRVRMSFGKFLLVKLRTALRDYYAVGKVEDGFLVFKLRGDNIRMSLNPDYKAIYRCMAVNWIDVDEEKNAIMTLSYKGITGYDAKKYDSLYVRCLTRPTINSARDKFVLVLMVITAIVGVGVLLVAIQNYMSINQLPQLISSMVNNAISSQLSTTTGVVGTG